MKKIKSVTPIQPTFKHNVYLCMQTLTNFPFIEDDFDAITNYELLCKVVEYLNKVIENDNKQNESILALYNAFVELKNYVDNYFDNLDVQEEINNKLDEMVEQGTLQEIIADYLNSKAVFGFDSVEDMKNATNLIDGSYATTLGYHTKNDGGGSLYKIRKITNDDVIDEMFIIEMADTEDELIAELIINDSLNIKSLGAYGNGTDADTSVINAAITYLKSKASNYSNYNNYLIFPEGNYLLNETINLSPYLKYKFNGNVTFLVNDITAFKIIYNSGDYTGDEIFNTSQWINNNFINADNLSIINTNENKTNNGIEIGFTTSEYNNLTSTEKSKFLFDNMNFNNIFISGFENAIYLHTINLYKNNFNNIRFYNNTNNVYVGNESINTGENIVFDKCLFGSCDYSIINNTDNFNINFINSSFDFNKKRIGELNKRAFFSFTNCHFEGCKCDGLSTLGMFNSTYSTKSNLSFNNCYSYTGNSESYKLVPLTSGKIRTIINGYVEALANNIDEESNPQNEFICSETISCTGYFSNKRLVSQDQCKNINGDFAGETAGTITTLTNYTITNTNVASLSIVEDGSYKSLFIQGTTNDSFRTNLQTKNKIYIDNQSRRLTSNLAFKLLSGSIKVIVNAVYYDINDSSIYTGQSSFEITPETYTDYYINSTSIGTNTPKNAYYCKITYNILLTDCSGAYITNIGSDFVN